MNLSTLQFAQPVQDLVVKIHLLYNYKPCVRIEAAYREAGFRSTLVDVPGLGHSLPSAAEIDKALAFVLEESN